MPTYFGIVLAYPFISAIIAIALDQSNIFKKIKNEFYLWIGYTILYAGLFLVVFSGFPPPPVWAAFIIYTAGYFGISVLRKFWFTESYDIFAPKTAGTAKT